MNYETSTESQELSSLFIFIILLVYISSRFSLHCIVIDILYLVVGDLLE